MTSEGNLNFSAAQNDFIEEIKIQASESYILTSIGMMFLMQAGFILIECGALKSSHYSYVVLKNVIDSVVGILAFWMAGFGISFGTSNKYGIIGVDPLYYCSRGFDAHTGQNLWIKLLFQFCFANTSTTIVSGLVIEKCRIEVYALNSFCMSLFIYPMVAHWAWNENGWLALRGYQDFAGSGVIHMLGGVVGLVGNIFSSSRIRMNAGKLQFPFLKCQRRLQSLQRQEEKQRKQVENVAEVREVRELKQHEILNEEDLLNLQLSILKQYDYPTFEAESHSHIFSAIGTYILFFGWFFFNGASAYTLFPEEGQAKVGMIAINTLLSGCSSGLIAVIFKIPIQNLRKSGKSHYFFRRSHEFDVASLSNGILSGLVAITASCNVVEPFGALFIGFFAGIIYSCFIRLLDYVNIDDPIEASAVHFANGLWGVLACVFFDTKHGLMSSNDNVSQFASVQIYAIFVIISWGVLCSSAFYGVFYLTGWLKYHPLIQMMGVGNFKMGELGQRFKRQIREEGHSSMIASFSQSKRELPLDNVEEDIFRADQEKEEEQVSSLGSKHNSDKDLISKKSSNSAQYKRNVLLDIRNNKVQVYPYCHQSSFHESSFRSDRLHLLDSQGLRYDEEAKVESRKSQYGHQLPVKVRAKHPLKKLSSQNMKKSVRMSQLAFGENGSQQFLEVEEDPEENVVFYSPSFQMIMRDQEFQDIDDISNEHLDDPSEITVQ